METDYMIRQLKYTANKHKNDTLRTFDTNITALCNDVIPKLELLEKYEQEEKNGLLLRLPCKVGDIVYNKKLEKLYVIEIRIADDICFHCCKDRANSIWTGSDFSADDFGKVVFLTREEAEAKLAEVEDNSCE